MDVDVERIAVSISATAEGVEQAFKAATDAGEKFESQLIKIGKQSLPVDVVKSQLQNLIKQLENTNQRIEEHKQRIKKLKAEYQGLTLNPMGGKYTAAEIDLMPGLKEKMAAARQEIAKAEAQLLKLEQSSDKTAQKIWQLDDALDEAANGAKDMGQSSKDMGDDVAASAAQVTVLGVSLYKIIGLAGEALNVFKQTQNAMRGLEGAAEGAGASYSDLQSRARDLASDGLIPLADAATSLKNLLARGYSLDQAVTTIERLKDSSAYARQGQLSMGEAVRGATEGLKNENSVLVDNAGVTKNVSVMWKEYAESLGKSVNDLTQAEKIQAEYNGIMNETRFQVGDAQKYLEGYAGAEAMAGANALELGSALGELIANGLAPFLTIVSSAAKATTSFIENNKALSTVLLTGVTVVVGYKAAVLLLANAKKLLAKAQVDTGNKTKSMIGAFKLAYAATKADTTATVANTTAKRALNSATLTLKATTKGLWAAMKANPIGIVIGLVGTLVTVFQGLKAKQEEQKQATLEAYQASQDKTKQLQEEVGSLQTLVREYEDLRAVLSPTAEQKQRLSEIERELVSQYGLAADGVDAEGQAYTNNLPAIQEAVAAKREELEIEEQLLLMRSKEAAGLGANATLDEIQAQTQDIRRLRKAWNDYGADRDKVLRAYTAEKTGQVIIPGTEVGAEYKTLKQADLSSYKQAFMNNLKMQGVDLANSPELKKIFDDAVTKAWESVAVNGEASTDALTLSIQQQFGTALNDSLKAESAEVSLLIKDFVDDIGRQMVDEGGNLNSASRDFMVSLLAPLAASPSDFEKIKDTFGPELQKFFASEIGQVDVAALQTEAQSIIDKTISGDGDADLSRLDEITKQLKAYKGEWQSVVKNLGLGEALTKELSNIEIPNLFDALDLGDQPEEIKRLKAEIVELGDKAVVAGHDLANIDWGNPEQAFAAYAEAGYDLDQLIAKYDELSRANETLRKAQANGTMNTKEAQEAYKLLSQALGLTSYNANYVDVQLGAMSSEIKSSRSVLQLLRPAVYDAANAMSSAGGAAYSMAANLGNATGPMKATIEMAIKTTQAVLAMKLAMNSGNPFGIISSVASSMAQLTRVLASLMAQVNAARPSYTGAPSTPSYGGGSSGGSSDSSGTTEADVDAEYRNQLKIYQHKKQMNQLTLAEERQYLQRLRDVYAKSQDAIWESQERLYEFEQGLLNDMADNVEQALQKRYEAQRKAEEKLIQDSIAYWDKWADENTSAIQKQIDALDELAEAENRDEEKAQLERDIAATKAQLAFEADEYNRRTLQKQLDQLISDYDKQIRDWEREDQKKALEAQKEEIQEKADAQKEALQDQLDAVNEYYDQLTEQAKIRGEAEKLILAGNQNEILNLLKSYAPDYDATGRTLGEQLYNGFVSRVQNIGQWFEGLNAQMTAYQNEINSVAAQSAARYWQTRQEAETQTRVVVQPVVVSPNITITQPVKSAVELRREIEKALQDFYK